VEGRKKVQLKAPHAVVISSHEAHALAKLRPLFAHTPFDEATIILIAAASQPTNA
jgi:hypothetical protein